MSHISLTLNSNLNTKLIGYSHLRIITPLVTSGYLCNLLCILSMVVESGVCIPMCIHIQLSYVQMAC